MNAQQLALTAELILEDYYYDRKALEEAGAWCWERMHEEQFTWPFVQKQMLDIVERTLSATKEDDVKDFLPTVRID